MDTMDEDAPAQGQRVRSTVTAVRKSKGRGFREDRSGREELYGSFEGLDGSSSTGPLKCRPSRPALQPDLTASVCVEPLALCACNKDRIM